MLANTAKGLDLATGDVVEDQVQLHQCHIPFYGIEVRRRGLHEDERFTHRLLAGGEIGEKRIPATAVAAMRDTRRAAPETPARRLSGEILEDFAERPDDEVRERIGIRQRRRDGLDMQQRLPSRANLRRAEAQSIHPGLLHHRHYGRIPSTMLRTGWRTMRRDWRLSPYRGGSRIFIYVNDDAETGCSFRPRRNESN